MIKDDALASRLNAVKKGEEIPIPPVEDVYFKKPEENPNIDGNLTTEPFKYAKPGIVFATSSYNLFVTFTMSMLFGLGAKAIFSTNWKFLGILGVGIIINQFFNLISRLKLFN